MNSRTGKFREGDPPTAHGSAVGFPTIAGDFGIAPKDATECCGADFDSELDGPDRPLHDLQMMTLAKPTFPAPDHDHGRCAADAIDHAVRVCEGRAQKFTPIRRHVLEALLSSHRPLGAYEVIDELAKSMPRPAPITVYRALDFLMENGLVHRIESRNAYLACAHDHDAAAMVAFLICDACGSVGEIPAVPVAQSLNAAARASGFAPKLSVVEITGTCAHCLK
jgi:Fur family zinc uptake transcriptional regulator